ncbi:nudix hydrolase 2-like [Spinacia oleracea]|uniref:Nudix hydrolase 2-like n=1 Tax=Spinacia oleracea TaxID=3562 RepID=A0ABM3R9E4_SPIOL|nr:nudix hydrolase 2-like [Spinacia oleracea]
MLKSFLAWVRHRSTDSDFDVDTGNGKKGVWIKLPIELANLVETVVKEGFWYHHAEPNYLMLVYWIPETINTLPANATHRVGVGAIVLTEKREMLVVQEKSGRLRGTGVWNIPIGIVDEGEDICAAAIGEVKEETGVDAEFVEVVAFRSSISAGVLNAGTSIHREALSSISSRLKTLQLFLRAPDAYSTN